MPELPEVERIARGLEQALLGQCLKGVTVRWPGVVARPEAKALEERLPGHRLEEVRRRGKMILLRFPPWWLAIHLRMTGQLQVRPGRDPSLEADRHVHLWFDFDHTILYYRDMRKFGRLWLVSDLAEATGQLGLEPLSPEFTPSALARILKTHRRQVKPLLLDQRLIAGLGNIYVDESLWRAQLHPLRLAHTLRDEEISRLHGAIQHVLLQAIDHGGTTLRDYRDAHDEKGRHQEALAVYGRAGLPCPRCGAPIVYIRAGGRGTHLCPICQPLAPPK